MEKASYKKWIIADPITPNILEELKDYSPFLSQLLYNRGVLSAKEAEIYFNNFGSIYNPFKLKDMDKAVDAILMSIEHGKRIAIYGDYDVDGVTATALLVQIISKLHGDVCEYIPNRFEEGYGLNIEAIDFLADSGIDLIITVDCGIRSINEIEHARSRGLDLIVTDHHEPISILPECIAIINPKQEDDVYPCKNLAGVGLAYKLAEALISKSDARDIHVEDWLDLVAVGTVADLVPMVGENRALVKAGLKQLHYGKRPGLVSLVGLVDKPITSINSTDIGFVIGPRLNASGRLASANQSFDILTTDQLSKSGLLVQKLDDHNRERQKKTTEMIEEAERQIEKHGDDLILFANHKNFNEGVVGLVASRLTEKYYRPSIVCRQGDEYTRASCRSIKEFNITQALDRCSHLLARHGGHAMAAGFTVKNENIDALIENLRKIADLEIGDEELIPTLNADIEIELKELHPRILKDIDKLEPFGLSNPHVNIVSRNLDVKQYKRVGADKSHLRLIVSDGFITFNAIAFRQGDWADKMPNKIDLLFNYERNNFQGKESLQLKVKDIHPSE